MGRKALSSGRKSKTAPKVVDRPSQGTLTYAWRRVASNDSPPPSSHHGFNWNALETITACTEACTTASVPRASLVLRNGDQALCKHIDTLSKGDFMVRERPRKNTSRILRAGQNTGCGCCLGEPDFHSRSPASSRAPRRIRATGAPHSPAAL